MSEPYLSIVVATRNDDHGGGMLGRMQIFVDGLTQQCVRHGLDAELIFVEWNPPPDRPPLVDALRWPIGNGRLTVRIIEVPSTLHARFAHSDTLPLFQMIAKNAGIRRARAPFVLATNVDLLFSDGVMRAIAERRLERHTIYRVDRHDVDAAVPAGAPIEDQLRWCAQHVLRINARNGTTDTLTQEVYRIYAGLADLPRYFGYACLRLGAAIGRRDVLERIRNVTRRLPRRPTDVVRLVRRTVARARVRPHGNACGDFTLIARDDWCELRAYPEFEMYSLHIDSLLLYMGRYAALREHVFPDPVFHIEHGRGFKPGDEGRRELFAWLSESGIPWLTNDSFAELVGRMAETRRPLEVNDEHWGLGAHDLKERSLVL